MSFGDEGARPRKDDAVSPIHRSTYMHWESPHGLRN